MILSTILYAATWIVCVLLAIAALLLVMQYIERLVEEDDDE